MLILLFPNYPLHMFIKIHYPAKHFGAVKVRLVGVEQVIAHLHCKRVKLDKVFELKDTAALILKHQKQLLKIMGASIIPACQDYPCL